MLYVLDKNVCVKDLHLVHGRHQPEMDILLVEISMTINFLTQTQLLF
jgi:hypothetical protein